MVFKSKKGKSGASPKQRKTARKSTELVRLATELPNEEVVPPLLGKRVTETVDYTEESLVYDDDDDDEDPEEYYEPLFLNSFDAVKSHKNIRMAVAVYFEVALGSPADYEWKARGTITTICKTFNRRGCMSFRRTVQRVLLDVLHCQECEIPYTAEGNYAGVGRPCIILIPSVEAEIIADSMEMGNSLKMSTHVVNLYRKENELGALTQSAVRGCFVRLKPQIRAVKKGKQGSDDIESAWCRASMRWFGQLLLRFGEITFSHPMFVQILGEDVYDEENPPDCYNVKKLTPLDLSKIAWYDEMHKKCFLGFAASRIGKGKENVSISFPRDANGKLDLQNGNYPKDPKEIVQVKYEKECRFCFGVYLSKVDGVEEGRKISAVFDYTDKKIITRTEKTKLRLQQIGYIRGKKGK